MSRNYIEITEKKIENIKNNLRVYTVDKLKKELEEATGDEFVDAASALTEELPFT